MIALRPVLFLDGLVLLALGLAMAFPALASGNPLLMPMDVSHGARVNDSLVFLGCSMATMFVAGLLVLGARPGKTFRLDFRQTLLLAGSALLLSSLCAAFPLRFSSASLSFADAWFEAVSGLTTTGATVMQGLDQASPVVLLWRALLNWLGGAGIIMLGVVLMPTMKIGGLQLFSRDVAEGRGGLRVKIASACLWIILGYGGFTLFAIAALNLAGMKGFDALCHGLSAISTGGFSTSDWSLRSWGAAVHWVIVIVMIIGASPLPLIAFYRHRRAEHPLFDDQFRFYGAALLLCSLILGLRLWERGQSFDLDLVRVAVFHAVSMVTTTGFVFGDFAHWGGFAHVAFFVMAFVGGCTGSASGSLKLFRWQIMGAKVLGLIRRVVYPHRVIPISFNGESVSSSVVESVFAFITAYLITFAVFAILLAGCGLDLLSALSASASALGNVGRAMGDAFSGAGSWGGLPRAAKWLLSAEMVVGRLEVFTVLIVFTPAFWKE